MKKLENNDGLALPSVVESAYGLYPGLVAFSDVYDASDYIDWVEQSNGDPVPAPLVVYIQAPEEGNSCSGIAPYILQELQMQGRLFDSDRAVQQLICSGSMATEWADDQLYQLVSVVQKSFLVTRDSLYGWCVCFGQALPDEKRLQLFRKLGFSNMRVSLIDDGVNHRHEQLETISVLARRLGYLQISFDLYCHSREGNRSVQWLESLLSKAQPDRICLVVTDQDSRHVYVDQLVASGYQSMGLDWFVRPNNQWWASKLDGQLHWSMTGFTDMPGADVVGVGPGAISSVGDTYSQNEARLTEYQNIFQDGGLPIIRGLELEVGDILRREIIVMILTHASIGIRAIEEKWGICFEQFFSYELSQLQVLQQAGLLEIKGVNIAVHTSSRRGLVEVCSIFDLRQRTAAGLNPVLSTV